MGPPTRAALCGSLWGIAVATVFVAAAGFPRATPATLPLAVAAPPVVRPVPASAVEIGSPVGVRIPAIGVAAALVPLGLNPDQTLQVPSDFAVPGWFQPGPEPGEPGAAVVAGHVDSRTGPAVFFALSHLQPGDEVEVVGDRGIARFLVEEVEQYAKSAFPTLDVYGPTPTPTLRLITCGGDFDRSTGHYLDNVVVYASLTPG